MEVSLNPTAFFDSPVFFSFEFNTGESHETHADGASRDRFAEILSTVCHSSSSKNTNIQSVSTPLPSALLLFIDATVHRDDSIEIRIEKSPDRK